MDIKELTNYLIFNAMDEPYSKKTVGAVKQAKDILIGAIKGKGCGTVKERLNLVNALCSLHWTVGLKES